PGNKDALQAIVAAIEADNLQEEDYTVGSWASLQSALDAANSVLLDDDATQDEVDEVLADLTAAVEALKLIDDGKEPEETDKSALQSIVDEVAGLNENKYTTASWAEFSKALQKAMGVLNNKDASQSEV